MNPPVVHSIEYFNEWFAEAISPANYSVASIIEALNRHPIASDETAQDYIMPMARCRESTGRFRIYGENQDGYYCFVEEGNEQQAEPPVYFETYALDLKRDYGFEDSEILQGDRVLVARQFSDFLWQMLGHHICLRMESGGHFSASVSGILFHRFDRTVNLADSFFSPLHRKFPAGFTCLISNDTIYIPEWGAAFRTIESRHSFINKYSPVISESWSQESS